MCCSSLCGVLSLWDRVQHHQDLPLDAPACSAYADSAPELPPARACGLYLPESKVPISISEGPLARLHLRRSDSSGKGLNFLTFFSQHIHSRGGQGQSVTVGQALGGAGGLPKLCVTRLIPFSYLILELQSVLPQKALPVLVPIC